VEDFVFFLSSLLVFDIADILSNDNGRRERRGRREREQQGGSAAMWLRDAHFLGRLRIWRLSCVSKSISFKSVLYTEYYLHKAERCPRRSGATAVERGVKKEGARRMEGGQPA
jgi:hypothetical protein